MIVDLTPEDDFQGFHPCVDDRRAEVNCEVHSSCDPLGSEKQMTPIQIRVVAIALRRCNFSSLLRQTSYRKATGRYDAQIRTQ
jgi:hypothetical protein